MRPFVKHYETEIRLGLVVIVVLLLLLNISSVFILHKAKRQLTEAIDQRLSAGLSVSAQYLLNNKARGIPIDQISIVRSRYALDHLGVISIADSLNQKVLSQLSLDSSSQTDIGDINRSQSHELEAGAQLFRSSRHDNHRIALAVIHLPPSGKILIAAAVDSPELATISSATETTLYIAIAVLILIIPMAIGLPRVILRPFRRMRDAAREAGRWSEPDNDDVGAVIKSYETIIDELKADEAKLKQLYDETSDKAQRLERWNRYVLKSIGSGIIVFDLSGKVVSCNGAALTILGYSEDQVVGKHYLVAFPRENELSFLVEAALERGETSGRRELELELVGSNTVWLGVESSLIFDDTGRTIGVTLHCTDLTEIKKLHSELEINRRLAALGEMTGGLAHQLRNSLAAISGFAQLLVKKTTAEPTLADLAQSIKAEAAASESMVSRFLTFARPLSISEEACDLRRLLADCVEKLSLGLSQKEINLRIDGPGEMPIIADSLLLKEALTNLIDNSVQAVGFGGRIDISCSAIGTDLHIIVADNGPGIAAGFRDKIFTPFVSSKPSGTGLGLALTRKIITLHNGTISFDPSPRVGAVCRITLANRFAGATAELASPATALKKR